MPSGDLPARAVMREPIDGGVRHGHVEGEANLRIERLQDEADEVAMAAEHQAATIGMA